MDFDIYHVVGVFLNQHFIPEQRVQQLLEDSFGVSVATASITEFNQMCANQLIEFEQIRELRSLAENGEIWQNE